MTSHIVSLRNRVGRRLLGMLDEPAAGKEPAFAALLLSPGVKTRVGPHRLYRKLAPPFLSRGIPVLRLDLEGFGDSEGEAGAQRLDEIYRSVELGRHVDDVLCALDWLETNFGRNQVIAGGLCGGAITALHAATRDLRIAGLYAIGFPVALHGTSPATYAVLSHGEMQSKREVYLRKLMEPAAWLRLLCLKSDFALMLRVFRGRAAPLSGAPDLNPIVPAGFAALRARERPALLIFGERDRLRFDYQEKVAPLLADAAQRYSGWPQVAVIPRSNHVLGDPVSVAEAIRVTGAWLDACFLAGSPVPDPASWPRPETHPATA